MEQPTPEPPPQREPEPEGEAAYRLADRMLSDRALPLIALVVGLGALVALNLGRIWDSVARLFP